ncbi:MAG: hypothetical protein Ct9H300mP28_23480 [Pseudomonadota bacterium]|nr:MAG: hypothetical protein Ct9H300mP28_23480 [Pseudomonadota bacterium]
MVQGVGYRFLKKFKAESLGLEEGQNLRDGSVFVTAKVIMCNGQLCKMVLKRGPRRSSREILKKFKENREVQ